MNKQNIVVYISDNTGMSIKQSTAALETMISSIKKALMKRKKVILLGFGTFSVVKRKARKGRNPGTGEPIKISESMKPKFSPSKELKDIIR